MSHLLSILTKRECPLHSIISNVLSSQHPISNKVAFSEAIKELQLGTVKDEASNCSFTTLEFDLSKKKFSVVFVHEVAPFASGTFAETEFSDKMQEYHYLKLFRGDDVSFTCPFLCIRVDKQGYNAELKWLEKTPEIAGKQVLQIADQLLERANVKYCYLNDVSARNLTLSDGRLIKLSLRVFLAIATPDGSIFYKNYELVECVKSTTFDFKQLTQSKNFYYAALKKVREVKLVELHDDIFATNEKVQECIKTLFEKYQMGTDFKTATFHDLMLALYQASQENKDSLSVNDDIYMAQHCFLTNQRHFTKITKSLSLFELAIDILHQHTMWRKSYVNLEEKTTLTTFTEQYPASLLDLVGTLRRPRGLEWKHVVGEHFKESLKRPLSLGSETESSPKRARSVASDEIELDLEVEWYLNPEELSQKFFEEQTTTFQMRLERFKSLCTIDENEDCISWSVWVSIPKKWNGCAAQKEASILITLTDVEGGALLTIHEYTQVEIDDMPQLVEWEITEHAAQTHLIHGGSTIKSEAINDFMLLLGNLFIP